MLVIAVMLAAPGVAAAQEIAIGSPPATPTFENEFADVSGYWKIAWEDDWQATAYSAVDDGELLELQDGHWTVRLQGPVFDPLSSTGALVPGDARSALLDFAAAVGVSHPLFSPDGRPLQHFAAGHSWRVYVQENGEPIYLDTRALDDKGAFLYISATVTGGYTAFNENEQNMMLLLENLTLLR
jgi:hypothetical protein